ncbi:MAG: molecular chaperone TorD family protein [Desulfobacterales bacterium]|nr:molecular chaperone TorD family protein [Desulfobacterales bacterium]
MSDLTSIKTPFNDCGAELLVRSQGYRLLAVLLRHPEIGGKKNLTQTLLKDYKKLLVDIEAPWKNRLLVHVKKLVPIRPHISKSEWIGEYEYCFGHTAHSKVSPYELEYGEEHSHREPQELADITAFYQAFGLQVSEKSRERGDHISIEFELMHFLTFKMIYALERGEKEHAVVCEEAALRFLSDHLARWIPAFATRLAQTARSDWMRAIADFCLGFILIECEIQGVDAGDQNLPVRVIEEKLETGCVSCHLSPFAKDSGSSS